MADLFQKEPLTEEQIERINNWLAALRSEEYVQGCGYLCINTKGVDYYCCLGVACALSSEVVREDAFQDGEHLVRTYRVVDDPYYRVTRILPDVVKHLYGLRECSSLFYRADGDVCALTTLNDHGSTFGEIADIVEQELQLKLEEDRLARLDNNNNGAV